MTDDEITAELQVKVVGAITTGVCTDIPTLQQLCRDNWEAANEATKRLMKAREHKRILLAEVAELKERLADAQQWLDSEPDWKSKMIAIGQRQDKRAAESEKALMEVIDALSVAIDGTSSMISTVTAIVRKYTGKGEISGPPVTDGDGPFSLLELMIMRMDMGKKQWKRVTDGTE